MKNGGLAQLGEHLLCKQGVKGSIPLISTINKSDKGSEEGRIAQVVSLVFRRNTRHSLISVS